MMGPKENTVRVILSFALFLLVLLFLSNCGPYPSSDPVDLTSKKYRVHGIAFYNLENLFDTIDDPYIFDESSPLMELDPKLRQSVYWQKNANMAKVISEIGKDLSRNSPAIIGVAEVENQLVLNDLVNDSQLVDKKYGIIHYDSPDNRGIDVALLYQERLFRPFSSSVHEVIIYDINNPSERRPTRDVLLVSGVLETDTLHILVNHWPSRFGGEKRSRPNRERAAGVNRKIVDSLLNSNSNAKIIIMGDLNDGPYNSSLKKVLRTSADKDQVLWDGLYNPMENMLKKKGLGTIAYQDAWDIFDQIIVSKNLISKNYDSYQFYKAEIYNPNYLITPSGRWKGYPFRSYSNGAFTGGYSDHFPVYIYVIKRISTAQNP